MSENRVVTIEKFLSFWNHYNVHIIEGLIALIVILSLVQAFRLLFGKKSSEHDISGANGIDAAQLEKTLQKILDSQSSNRKSEDMGIDVDLAMSRGGGAADEQLTAEVAQLRKAVQERQKTIETLQAQVKAAESGAAAAAQAGAAAASGDGISATEKTALNAKILDLESRLSEYEIIAEDIADLSRYKQENDKLKAELEALKAGGAVATPSAAAPVAEGSQDPMAESVPNPAMPEPELNTMAEPLAEPVPTPEPDANADSLIDDDLMKEFAAAVEGQKAVTNGGAEPAAESDDTDKLMDEFQNFVTKKS